LDDNLRLALIRTLLAAERNYLSIERTQLAQLRTGLSLAVIPPSAAATLSYVISFTPETFRLEIILYIFLTALTISGVYLSVWAYRKLSKTRATQMLIHKRELEVIAEAESLKHYFKDILTQNNS
jgi:uncharacterized membrane protein YidH (DUF202 family)